MATPTEAEREAARQFADAYCTMPCSEMHRGNHKYPCAAAALDRDTLASLLASTREAATLAERERCAALCDGFVRERGKTEVRVLAAAGVGSEDMAAIIGAKASEAARCADAIRKGDGR